MIDFTVHGKPQGAGHVYTPSQTVAYEDLVAIKCREAMAHSGNERYTGPVCVTIYALYPIPKSCTRAERAKMLDAKIRPLVKPDVDNISKIVCDALNGVAYDDDKQIVALNVIKAYGAEPCICVNVDKYPCDAEVAQ